MNEPEGKKHYVFINKLRKYLRHNQSVKIINMRGKGFKLVVNS